MRLEKLIISLSICSALLTGCWNYKDIEMVQIAAGIAIDRDEKTKDYNVTIEIVNQQSDESETAMKSILVESTGETIFDAIRNAIMTTGTKIFWGHCKVMIVSQAIAREGILPISDYIVRDSETRPDIWMVISMSNSANEILKSKTEANKIVSYEIAKTLDSIDSISKFIPIDFIDQVNEISNPDSSQVLPTVYTEKVEDKNNIKVSGSAVFKQDKMMYLLDENESQIVLLIKDKLKGGILTLIEGKGNEEVRLSLEIFSSKTMITPIIENDKITMKIDSEIKLGFAEIGGSENFISKDKREIVEKDLEEKIALQMVQLIRKSQINDSTDIFDFNGSIKRRFPKYWKEIVPNWEELYTIIEVQPNIEVMITGSAFSNKPVKIEE